MKMPGYLIGRGASGLFFVFFIIAISIIGQKYGVKGLIVFTNISGAVILFLALAFAVYFVIKIILSLMKK